MRCRRWCRRTRWGIDNGEGVVRVGRIFDMCIVWSERLRVVLLGAVFLLVLTFWFLLFVQLALIFLVFRDAGLPTND